MLRVTQLNGVTHVSASCSGGEGSVDFGDGTSAKLTTAAGTITRTYSSPGSRRVIVTCSEDHRQSISTTIATVGGTSGRPTLFHCSWLSPTRGAANVLEHVLARLGFGICHRQRIPHSG
jgi:hypothetical protein